MSGAETLLPQSFRQLLRVDELILASETNACAMIMGQLLPFTISKLRHIFVAWGSSFTIVQFLFFRVFTSYFEVGMNMITDAATSYYFLQKWLQSLLIDLRLRWTLNRLKCGYLTVASKHG